METLEFFGYKLYFKMDHEEAEKLKDILTSILVLMKLDNPYIMPWYSPSVQKGASGYIVYQYKDKFNLIFILNENFELNNLKFDHYTASEQITFSLKQYKELKETFRQLII